MCAAILKQVTDERDRARTATTTVKRQCSVLTNIRWVKDSSVGLLANPDDLIKAAAMTDSRLLEGRGSGRRLASQKRKLSSERLKVIAKAKRLHGGKGKHFNVEDFAVEPGFGDGLDLDFVKKKLQMLDLGEEISHLEVAESLDDNEIPNNIVCATVKDDQGRPLRSSAESSKAVRLVGPPSSSFRLQPTPELLESVSQKGLEHEATTFDGGVSLIFRLQSEYISKACGFHENRGAASCEYLIKALTSVVSSSARTSSSTGNVEIRGSRWEHVGSCWTHARPADESINDSSVTRCSASFGADLNAENVQKIVNVLPDGMLLVHVTLFGLGSHNVITNQMSAQEAYARLRRQLNDSDKLGNSPKLVYSEPYYDSMSDAQLLAKVTEGRQPYAAWIIVLCVLGPTIIIALLLGIIWRTKKCPCPCAGTLKANYGVDVDTDQLPPDLLTSNSSSRTSSKVEGRTWIVRWWYQACKQTDKILHNFLI